MRILLATLAAFTALTSSALAASSNIDDIAVYAGQFSVGRDPANRSVEAGIEYRWADQFNGIRPTVGIMGNTDSAFYGYGGLYWDLPLGTEPFMITPGVAVGYYNHGDSKPLGSEIEFRDTIELSYKFDDGQRIGGQFTHMSNAGIGNKNPGTESWQVIYSHPTAW